MEKITHKKEIVVFLPDTSGGLAYFTYNLLKYSTNKEYFYKVILYKHKEDKRKKLNLNFNADEQINFSYSNKDNLYNVFKRLKKYISNDKSIIIANDGLELRIVNSFKLKNPVFYIVHGDNAYYYKLIEQYHKIINKIISVSSFVKKNTSVMFPEISPNKISVIYAPVPEINYQKKENIGNKINLIFVGNIVKTKGIYLLKPLINRLKNEKINFNINIVGSGKEESNLKEDLKIFDNVFFCGQLPQNLVFKFFLQSDILIFPSESEGLPLVIVEAMKAGVVPLCNDIPSGIPEIIFDGKTGYRIKNNEIEKYVELIKQFYYDREKLLKISNNAIKFANKNFNPYLQSEKYINTFTEFSENNLKEKMFLNLPLGGILNKKWLPNFIVKSIRKVFNHPKL